jgi:hypothetical protein
MLPIFARRARALPWSLDSRTVNDRVMSQSASQAAVFYRDVAATRRVWTIRDEGGFPAPLTRSGRRAQPFWSSLSRVERVIKRIPAYAGFQPVELTWETFRDEWLPELRRDGFLVGVNWSGRTVTGYDLEPDWVQHSVEVEIENLSGPPATPLEEREDHRGGIFHRFFRRGDKPRPV